MKGEKKGRSETFVDRLPGGPDNIKVDKEGNFYVCLVSSKSASFSSSYMDVLGRYPTLRKWIAHSLAVIQMACEYAYSVFPSALLKRISFSVNRTSKDAEFDESTPYRLSSIIKYISFQVGQYETFADILPSAKRVTIVKIDKNGAIIDSWHGIDGRIGAISDIEIVGDYAYLGSPFNNYLARVRL